MAVKVAINGFGRIGRLAFRQMFGAEGYDCLLYTSSAGGQLSNTAPAFFELCLAVACGFFILGHLIKPAFNLTYSF